MCINITHLVFKPPCDANDEVTDDSLDSTKGSDVLSSTMVQFNIDGRPIWAREGH